MLEKLLATYVLVFEAFVAREFSDRVISDDLVALMRPLRTVVHAVDDYIKANKGVEKFFSDTSPERQHCRVLDGSQVPRVLLSVSAGAKEFKHGIFAAWLGDVQTLRANIVSWCPAH
eukprot:13810497-Alexandrium_andersonii.AAC.1